MNLDLIMLFFNYGFYFIIFIILFISIKSLIKDLIIMKYMKNFAEYYAVLDYHLNKSYDIIHKDRILVYSLDGQKVSDEEFNKIAYDFVKLSFKIMGFEIKKQLIKLYGDEDTLIFNLVEYFNTRYEEDSIRKQSLEDITEDNDVPQTIEGL